MRSRLYTKVGLHRFLSSLVTSTGDSVTVYVAPASFPAYAESFTPGRKYDIHAAELRKAVKSAAVIDAAGKYGTGAAIFWSELGKQIILPAFPIAKNEVSEGKLDVSVLRDVLDRKYVIGVALVT